MRTVEECLLSQSATGKDVWPVFQSIFSEYAGISVQVFDNKGRPVSTAFALPSLCAFLQRYPQTQRACRKDCFHKAGTCRDARKTISARCYAGLSYRVIPIRSGNRLHAVVLAGRALTEVFGAEQNRSFFEKYSLSRESFAESLAGVRSLGSSDLERFTAFVRRLAVTFLAGDLRARHRRTELWRTRSLIDVARQATAFHESEPAATQALLVSLTRLFGVPAAAILTPGDRERRFDVRASTGLGDADLHILAGQDWSRVFAQHGRGPTLVLSDRQQMLKAGLDLVGMPLVVQRLDVGSRVAGCVVLSGAMPSVSDLRHLTSASDFVAARMEHLACRARAEQTEEEARMLGRMVEKFHGARSVGELLELALESAMSGLHARRGSILLAERKGRITELVLRGDHAPICGTIRNLRPDSVSHKVFFDRRPMLVQDAGRESGLTGGAQFPYTSRSFVSVPLRENGHALGVLQLTERAGEDVFTPRDLSLLERLGLQTSREILKSRLEAEVRTLRVASCVDFLTGAYNRRHFDEQLIVETRRASRSGQPLGVAMIDIDSFKRVNDTLGHEYGDRVLQLTANTIRNHLRSSDILARWGGDEFGLILPGTDAGGAVTTVEKIRGKIASLVLPPARPEDPPQGFTVSIGLAVYPETTQADELLQRADRLLLRAKMAGGNTVLHSID